VKSKSDPAPQRREDITGRKPGTAWPLDVTVSAAMALVDQQLAAKRVADELKILLRDVPLQRGMVQR
jgi:hypothetical protein